MIKWFIMGWGLTALCLYEEIQRISDIEETMVGVDICDTGQFVAVVTPSNVHMYRKNGDNYRKVQILRTDITEGLSVGFSGGGQKVVVGCTFGIMVIFSLVGSSTYSHEQTINSTDHYRHVHFSSNNEWLIGCTSSDVDIYHYDTFTYNLHQTLSPFSHNLLSVSMGNSQMLLGISDVSNSVMMYKYDGATFVHDRTFTYADVEDRDVFVSEEFVVVGHTHFYSVYNATTYQNVYNSTEEDRAIVVDVSSNPSAIMSVSGSTITILNTTNYEVKQSISIPVTNGEISLTNKNQTFAIMGTNTILIYENQPQDETNSNTITPQQNTEQSPLPLGAIIAIILAGGMILVFAIYSCIKVLKPKNKVSNTANRDMLSVEKIN